MKSKKIVGLIIILMILFIKIDVKAAECSTADMSVYRIEANNLNVTHELDNVFDGKGDPNSRNYFMTLIISNMTENINVKIGKYTLDIDDSENGEIKIGKLYHGGQNVKVEVYTNKSTACPNKLLRTINYQLPYWNKYSEREECKGYEELTICQINANTTNIEESEFTTVFEKEKKEYEEQQKVNKKNKSIFDWYLKNKKITIPVTVTIVLGALGTGVVLFIINRKKIGIDLGAE